jgi:hypothetical protein
MTRIPRKLGGKLRVEGDSAEMGWGIYLRTGFHWNFFFLDLSYCPCALFRTRLSLVANSR